MRAKMLWICTAAAFAAAVSATPSLGAADAPDENAEKRIAELEAQVAQLEKSVEALGAIVEGTAHPINLGRTSLARVCASSVNGGRSLVNKYYGVLNAFDDGNNWIGHINYTYWLSGGGPNSWVKVVFDHPVSVTAIVVEGVQSFSAQLAFAKDGERIEPSSTSRLELDPTAHGVTVVRLTFGDNSNTRVDEVRIMGYVPPGVEYTEGSPRVLVTEQDARVVAQEAFRAWAEAFLPRSGDPKVEEHDGAISFTYHRDGVDVVRITVDMSSGETKVEPLVRLVESSSDSGAEAPKGSDSDASEEPLIHRVFPPSR